MPDGRYLGIDCGSVSIKAVLIQDGALQGKVYLQNRGIIETIRQALKSLPQSDISGVGVTGSGKEFMRALVGGDYMDSEIISHLVATLKYQPDIKTILDIGGEDSKLIIIKDGMLSAFQMNRDCGGGTGSMIETIASRVGVKIDDVGDIALQSRDPANLPGKCGIFCQSAAVSELSKGRSAQDILMGVCRALVGNYLAVLAKGKRLLEPVIFQGATAQNKALVRCFEDALGCKVLVPEHCSFMGAIGIAELTREQFENDGHATNFRGIERVVNGSYQTETSHCGDCENRCELLSLYCDGEILGRSGSRCGKNNV